MDQRSSGGFHEVGGITFEIPPLPDELDLGSSGVLSASNGTVPGTSNISNGEEFGSFTIPLPSVSSSSLPPLQQTVTSQPSEPKNDGEFDAFSGFQSSGVQPEFVDAVPPLPDSLTTGLHVTSNDAHQDDSRKAPNAGDSEEFWGFRAADDSQVGSTSPSGEVWSTLPRSDASVGFAAFRDGSDWRSAVSSGNGPKAAGVQSTTVCDADAGFADFANFASSTQPVVSADDDGFGDFTGAAKQPWPPSDDKAGAIDSPSLASTLLSEDFANFSTITTTTGGTVGAVTTVATSTTVSSATVTADTTNEDSFADFRAFSSPTSAPDLAPTAANSKSDGFADFGSFEGPSLSLNVASTTTETSNGSFGEFGSFEGGPVSDVVSSTTEGKKGDDFGGFGAFSDPVSGPSLVSSTTNGEKDDEFRSFNSPVPISSAVLSSTTGVGDDDFGEFGSFSGSTSDMAFSTKSASKPTNDFGSFNTAAAAAAEDDYGNFGSFRTSSPPVTSPPAQQQLMSGKKLVPSDVMLTCFPATPTSEGEEGRNCFRQLAQCVREGTQSQLLWTRLAEEALSSSGSLYKFVQSFLQDHFYSAIQVDPMLAPSIKPASGAFSAGGLVGDDPLSPSFSSSALLAAQFGFERTMTAAVPQMSAETDVFAWGSSTAPGNGPTLLDLSRPDSPLPEASQAPSLDKELLGLDFTSVDPSSGPVKEPSTPTSWMDSELLDLHTSNTTATTTTEDEEGRLGHRGQGVPQTVEQQLQLLGLDTTKTTWWTSRDDAASRELSLAAKTVLEKLPDLDFLLAESLLVIPTSS